MTPWPELPVPEPVRLHAGPCDAEGNRDQIILPGPAQHEKRDCERDGPGHEPDCPQLDEAPWLPHKKPAHAAASVGHVPVRGIHLHSLTREQTVMAVAHADKLNLGQSQLGGAESDPRLCTVGCRRLVMPGPSVRPPRVSHGRQRLVKPLGRSRLHQARASPRHGLPKLTLRVRFPSSAPPENAQRGTWCLLQS